MDGRGLIASLAVLLLPAGTSQPPAAGRDVVVIGDLHMGVGRAPAGSWDPHEDFRWATEFAAFLKAVDFEGGSAVDLVLNGDSFDLLYAPGIECGDGKDLGCTESEAVRRLERVLAGHRAETAALSAFARAGSNRIVFVPGDSDAALLFPLVRRRLLGEVSANATRAAVATDGFWLSGDGRILAEHGHQVGFSAHRFDGWPEPFRGQGGERRLVRPWGEQLADERYRRLEGRFPVVDNVAVLGAGLKYALAADETADADPLLVKYLLLTTPSWQQFRMELDDGDVEPPAWDLDQARAQRGAFLASALPDDDPIRPLAGRALARGTLDQVVEALSDDEIVLICDYRAAVRRARRRFEPVVSQFAPRGPAVSECARTPDTRGAVFDYFWRSRDVVFGRHIEALKRRLPAAVQPGVFVHGHTHLPDRSQAGANMISGGLLKIPLEGFSPVRGATTPLVINGGAWQRTITPVQLERVLAGRSLDSLQPEDLAPCYSFVRIPAYQDLPVPAVRYWRPDGSGGAWAAGPGCAR